TVTRNRGGWTMMTCCWYCLLVPTVWLAALALSPWVAHAAAADSERAFLKVDSNLRAAAAKLDITPPEGTPVVGHVREVRGVRDRLHASVLLLDDGQTRAGLVTLDLISSGKAMVEQLRGVVAANSGTPRENILVS